MAVAQAILSASSAAQIIPTVGIGKDDDGGKAAASQLKHFRNLVDETASKARFLSTFKGSGSLAKQDSGVSGRGSEDMGPIPSVSPGKVNENLM